MKMSYLEKLLSIFICTLDMEVSWIILFSAIFGSCKSELVPMPFLRAITKSLIGQANQPIFVVLNPDVTQEELR